MGYSAIILAVVCFFGSSISAQQSSPASVLQSFLQQGLSDSERSVNRFPTLDLTGALRRLNADIRQLNNDISSGRLQQPIQTTANINSGKQITFRDAMSQLAKAAPTHLSQIQSILRQLSVRLMLVLPSRNPLFAVVKIPAASPVQQTTPNPDAPAATHPAGTKLTQPLTSLTPDVTGTLLTLIFDPSDASTPPHTHPGPSLGYIIEGEFLFQVKGKPIQILQAGEAFYEDSGAVHIWGGNASNSTICRAVVALMGNQTNLSSHFLTIPPSLKPTRRLWPRGD